MQDSILLQAIKNDNKRAFKKAFETYYKPLCIYIKSFTKDLDTAEEIVQSTFIYFWNKRHDIEIHTSLKSYLYMMCYNNYLVDSSIKCNSNH
ncbi:sigma factor [Myroides odoratimimus]|uniref:sigma factor n=1 Tax=Myroides odoratimimus TaxID=76832 RepID=UPI0038513D48